MVRLYFHTFNGEGDTRDDEGIELEDDHAAYSIALENIRSIVADEARRGLIDLEGHIDVADGEGQLVLLVPFVEAFDLKLPDGDEEWSDR